MDKKGLKTGGRGVRMGQPKENREKEWINRG